MTTNHLFKGILPTKQIKYSIGLFTVKARLELPENTTRTLTFRVKAPHREVSVIYFLYCILQTLLIYHHSPLLGKPNLFHGPEQRSVFQKCDLTGTYTVNIFLEDLFIY